MTAIGVFILLCLAGVFVLAMRRAPIWVWAARRGRRHPGLADGARLRQLARAGLQSAGPACLGAGGRARRPLHSAAAPRGTDQAAVPQDQGHPAEGLGHRAGGAERRHHRLRCRAVLRPARLGEAARRPADHADRGGEGVPRRADQRAVPHGQRLDDPPQPARRSPRRSGTSSRSTASSACSSPRSTGASASRRRRSRWCWARSPRARPTCARSSWCRTRWARAS